MDIFGFDFQPFRGEPLKDDCKFRKLPFYPLNYKGALGVRLVDDLAATIETALRAYVVIQDGCTAIRANCHLRDDCLVVSSSLISALLGDLMFRMCHG